MRNKKTAFVLFSILVLVAILTACSGSGTEDTASLDGTSWVLVTYSKNSPLAGTEPTLKFEGGQVSGSASCNSYGGSYIVDDSSLNFGDMFMTEMYCTDPEGIMDQENAYLQLLGQAHSYEIQDGTLVIFSGDHETLTFAPAN